MHLADVADTEACEEALKHLMAASSSGLLNLAPKQASELQNTITRLMRECVAGGEDEEAAEGGSSVAA